MRRDRNRERCRASGTGPAFAGLLLLAVLCLAGAVRTQAAYSLTVNLRNISDNTIVTQIGWTSPGTVWVRANQYLEVLYSSTDPAWGVQIYTDNHNAGANPLYTGPTTFGYEGAGLIGATSTTTYATLAWCAYDTLPGTPPAAPGADLIPSGSIWSYFKDPMQTAGTYPFVNGEPYITFVNPSGVTLDNNITRGAATSPVYLYLSVNFYGRPNQVYRTNQLTIELYHL
jgi:hypothetical protein